MRWILWIVAGLAIVGILVVVIGYSLPKGHTATRTATSAAAARRRVRAAESTSTGTRHGGPA